MEATKKQMLRTLWDLQTLAVLRTNDTEILVAIRNARLAAQALLTTEELTELSGPINLPEEITAGMADLHALLNSGGVATGNLAQLRRTSEASLKLHQRLRCYLQVELVAGKDLPPHSKQAAMDEVAARR
jgi:hypothetical protein